jgi:cyclopropane-fatty-acyl-phospholipid synthase
MKQLFDSLGKLQYGSLELTTPEGEVRLFKGPKPGPEAHAKLYDWGVMERILRRGDIGMGETYIEGLWDTDDLEALMTMFTLNLDHIEHYAHGTVMNRLMFCLVNYWLRRNSKRGSALNIKKHYDVGNAFYRLWLDESMTYSAALYENMPRSLEHAQQAKYGRILEKLAGHENVLEIGCGWGGFAEAAASRGHRLTGITISPSQHEIASARVAGKADIRLQDYRDLKGNFDAIVSIEMFEAVGLRYWAEYFKTLRRNLSESGKALIQTITIRDDMFNDYIRRSDFIRTYTFPGGMLPSMTAFRQEAAKAGLKCKEVFNFGKDYAKTLSEWLSRFDQQKDAIMRLGYDEAFIRSWRFYLALCIGGFAAARTDVVQVELVRA